MENWKKIERKLFEVKELLYPKNSDTKNQKEAIIKAFRELGVFIIKNFPVPLSHWRCFLENLGLPNDCNQELLSSEFEKKYYNYTDLELPLRSLIVVFLWGQPEISLEIYDELDFLISKLRLCIETSEFSVLDNDNIIIYTSQNGTANVEVALNDETVWLSMSQLALLYNRDKSVISKHLKNIFKEGELAEESNVQKMHIANSDKPVSFYNLDVIISLGYRINSKQATQFRQWATQRLKEYLTQGYSINQKRLDDLQQVVSLIQNTHKLDLSNAETKGLLDIINLYTQSFILLNQFDSNNLDSNYSTTITYQISYDDAQQAISNLKYQLIDKGEATPLFGKEKDESFKGILGNIVQSFGGDYLYPSIEEQASHLLYFIIKNHPFTDGNKRIGAFMFIWFLEKNKHRFKNSGELKINDNALVAIALLVAQSSPNDKNLMIQLINNLISN